MSEVMLEYHLQYNHFPPVTTLMVPYCREAIAAVNEGDWDREIEFPNGEQITAGQLFEDLHLECFYEGDDD